MNVPLTKPISVSRKLYAASAKIKEKLGFTGIGEGPKAVLEHVKHSNFDNVPHALTLETAHIQLSPIRGVAIMGIGIFGIVAWSSWMAGFVWLIGTAVATPNSESP